MEPYKSESFPSTSFAINEENSSHANDNKSTLRILKYDNIIDLICTSYRRPSQIVVKECINNYCSLLKRNILMHHRIQIKGKQKTIYCYPRLLSYLRNSVIVRRLTQTLQSSLFSSLILFILLNLLGAVSSSIAYDKQSSKISTVDNNNNNIDGNRLAKYRYIATLRESSLPFDVWINQTQHIDGIFLNHSSYSEGEVLLFRTKKSRHRAIAVMNVASFGSKFSDALTFKEWLKTVYTQNKALKLSVRTTEVVRPVLQHLYASKGRFRAPIIIHANTFANNGRNLGSTGILEKPVDAVVFINAVSEYLPEAVISLGWTQSADYAALNRLGWRQTFHLIDYIHNLRQPVILNMKLNDALHSLPQLEWLLGIESLAIFVIIRSDASDFITKEVSLSRLASFSLSSSSLHKILFDVDDLWRRRIKKATPEKQVYKKEKRSIEPESWTNLVFVNSHDSLSTSLVSSHGVAFLGWPNSLFVSNRASADYPAKQRIAGRVMFFPKKETNAVAINKESGMMVQLFEEPIELIDLSTPKIRNAIRVFIGYEGRIIIENSNPLNDNYSNRKSRAKNGASAKANGQNYYYYYYSFYHKSSIGQLPKRPCYDFEIVDRNWRVELDIQTAICDTEDGIIEEKNETDNLSHHLYLQLDTPVTRSRKSRKVAIGKSGDGAIDFIFHEIVLSNSGNRVVHPLSCIIALLIVKQLIL